MEDEIVIRILECGTAGVMCFGVLSERAWNRFGFKRVGIAIVVSCV